MPHAATSRDTLYAMDSPSSIRSTVVGCGGAVDRGGRQANTGRSASRAPPAPTRASGAILLDDPLEGILEVRAELLGRTAHELHILLDRGLGLVAQRAH